jgi:RES domain-containing protein
LTRVYRILRKLYSRNPLDGEGAYRYGGRWSSRGTRLAYTSEHLSLAMLEYFVHIDSGFPPKDLVVIAADIPEDVARAQVDVGQLPGNWRQSPAPASLAAIGDAFAERRDAAILVVPSALVPSESNWLINPVHPRFADIRVHKAEPFRYDDRFFG